MWISKKKWKKLEIRITDLETEIFNQSSEKIAIELEGCMNRAMGSASHTSEENRKAVSGRKQPLSQKQYRELKKPKTEVCVATTEEKELFLLIGNERIQISGYNTKSIGGGLTEINVTITGETSFTELSTISRK